MSTSTQTTPLRVIPLGGLGEVGKNMMAVEYGHDIVVIDAGILFPKEDMLGVDLVLPDTTYLRERRERVRAILITHGHEDHIGALPYVLRDLNVPVYAPPLARDLIHLKLQEHHALRGHQLHEVQPGDRVELGSITAEFFRVCHSIPDACGIALHTPAGVVIHTGDFKIDHTPVDGRKLDMQRLAELGRQGVLLLLSDSTYAEEQGYTPSEQVVGVALDHVIANASGRVLVATFASLIARVQQVIDAAVKHDRKVAVVGRSMVNNVRMALENGYIKAPGTTVVPFKELQDLPADRQVVITTGSQGEPTSALVRIANRVHPQITIQKGDTVIISASPIPGNETVVHRTIDNLNRQGARVLHSRTALVHVHGHASQEELKTMLNLVKPHYFVPIHGEYRMLVAHAGLARDVGVAPEDIFVIEDGDVLEITPTGAGVAEHIDAGHIYVDGLRLWDAGNVVIQDRRSLARDGFVVVLVRIDHSTGTLAGEPEIVSGGFIDMDSSQELVQTAMKTVHRSLNDGAAQPTEWSSISSQVRKVLGTYLLQETGRRPMIIPVPVKV
jgi:ribonuclease J